MTRANRKTPAGQAASSDEPTLAARPGKIDLADAAAPASPHQLGASSARSVRDSLRNVIFNPIAQTILKRLLQAIPLLLIMSALSFFLVSLVGNPAQSILGTNATPATVKQLEQALGVNRPWYIQYWHWLWHALHGDLGNSLITGQPVTQILTQRLPVSISLILGAIVVSAVVGVTFGVYSAVRGGVSGRILDASSLLGFALPPFWVGGILIAIFAVKFRIFPAVGYVSITSSPSQWLRSITLPVLTLSIFGVANIAKQTREAMLDVLASDYIRMARASGLSPSAIILKHAMKNVAARVITLLGLLVIALITGTVLVESVFVLPGIGGTAVTAATEADFSLVQGVVVFFTLFIVGVNLLIDVAYGLLIPKAARR